jgi:amino acid adenylation domain-containing protein
MIAIHHAIESHARARPDARAIVLGDQVLSYRELNERANRVAHHLVRHGVGPEVVVGVHVQRSLELVVGLLGVLKAGAAYLPLDPRYPVERLAFMLEDCNAQVLLTDGSPLALAFTGVRVDLTRDAAEIAHEAATDLARAIDADNLAYIIYTSGSTGRPKGVLITHRHVVRLMTSTAAWFHFDERDVWTFFHSYTFDFSVWEIWGALFYGGTVVVVPEPVRRSPDELLQLLAGERVTVLNQIPSAFRHLIAAATRAPTRVPLALRLVIFGGEALELTSLVPWLTLYPQTQLVNMYGITETTVHVTYRPIDPRECHDARGSPIGIAIPDLQLHVLDAALQPVPDGAEGEIYVGGAGLARGYHHRAGLTAERFVPDPFSERPGSRLYKTGDLARRLPDGSSTYLGRNDAQVKIRGYRIETGEIAAALLSHPAVREAAVVARDLDNDDRWLVAYVVLSTPVATSELRDHLAGKLPSHMAPSAFVSIDALPTTPSGKIDFKALPAPPPVELRSVTAATDDQRTIAALWAELLRQSRFGIHDDFFALGGHSLLAIRLMAKIRAAMKVDVSISQFFASPTVAGLAADVARARAAARGVPLIEPAPHDAPLGASSAQERLWFVERMARAEARPPLNVTIAIHMRGVIDAAILARSLSEIVARHDSWRTNFRLEDHRLVLVIRPPFPVELSIVHQALRSDQTRDERIRQLAQEHARRPFDLTHDPLTRYCLVQLGPDDHVLFVTVHHIVYDGASAAVFVRELATLYEAFRSEAPSQLAPLAARYADIAHWQRRALDPEHAERQLDYWYDRLVDAPGLVLPTDHPRPSQLTHAGARLGVRIPPELTVTVHDYARREAVSPFVTMLAAFTAQLARHSGQNDLVIGTGVSLRDRPELEATIGLLLNMVALRVDASGDPSFRELVQRVRHVVVDAFANKDVPFDRVVTALKRKHDLGGGVFSVVMSNNIIPVVAAPRGQAWDVAFPDTGVALDDLSVQVVEHGDDLYTYFEYRTELFEPATIASLAVELHEILRDGLAAPDRPVSRLAGATVAVSPAASGTLAGLSNDPPSTTASGGLVDRLTVLFAEVLEVPEVGHDEDFFERGGHSILAAHLAERIEEVVGISVPLRAVFEAPTPAALARSLRPEPDASASIVQIARKISTIFAEALDVGSTDIDDSFFDLGGHSILAGHVVERISELFAFELPLRSIFESDTPRGLAQIVLARRHSS